MSYKDERTEARPSGAARHRQILHDVIYEAETPAGKWFDIILLLLILLSIVAVMLESIESLNSKYHNWFMYTEWALTFLFTIEYFLRIYSVKKPLRYMTSFYGVIDLLAILPTYLSFFLAGSQFLLTIRALRLLRVFRIFKAARYVREGQLLLIALRNSRQKLTMFILTVMTIVIIVGSFMYVIESPVNKAYSSIPQSMYWAIVTVTTVGYGDITPLTNFGRFLSTILMLTGYAIIAVPTGIFAVELTSAAKEKPITSYNCENCSAEGHKPRAKYCYVCGYELHQERNSDDPHVNL